MAASFGTRNPTAPVSFSCRLRVGHCDNGWLIQKESHGLGDVGVCKSRTSFLRGHDLGVGVQDGVPDGLQVGLELLGFQAATADGHDVRHVLQQEILDALRVLALRPRSRDVW